MKKRLKERIARLSPDQQRIARDRVWKENLEPCLGLDGKSKARVVIAYRNARALNDEVDDGGKGRSEKWYTKD